MRTPHLTIIGVTLLLVGGGGCTPSGDSGAGTGGVSGSGGQVASSGGSGPSGSGGGVTSSGGAGPSGGSGGAVVPASGGSPGSGGASSSGSGGRTASGGTGGTGDGASGMTGAAGIGEGGRAAVGGAHGGDAGGAGQGGRAGGGAGQAGSGGGGGASSHDPRAAAQDLDGFALLKPCFAPPSGCCCDENSAALLNTGMAPENQHLMKQFGGDAGATYNVKLRVVGVAERYWYTGGMLDPMSKIFYTGGLPTIHSAQAPNNNLSPGQGACKIHPPETDKDYPIPFTVPPEVAPADNCYNGFNIFAMTVSSPKQTYYLNYTTDYDNVDRQPHSVYKTDYTVTIPIAGQAKIDFYVLDGDHHQVANTNMSVPNVKNTTIKQPYSGNFLELEVVDVTRGN